MVEIDIVGWTRFNMVSKIRDHGLEVFCEFKPEFIKWCSVLKGKWGYYFPIDVNNIRNHKTLDELLVLRSLPRKPTTREYSLNSNILVFEFEDSNDAMLFKLKWS